MTATSVVGSRPTTFALNDAVIGERHVQPIEVLDDVVVGEDVAVFARR